MTGMIPTGLRIEVKLPHVLPEITGLVQQMIDAFNDWASPTYIKIYGEYAPGPFDETKHGEVPPTKSSRYVLFQTKSDLFAAIMNNCPAGCSIIQD